MLDYLLNISSHIPLGLALVGVLLVLLLCGLGFPLPEEVPLVLIGYLVYHGAAPLWVGIVLALLAILGGDTLLFFIGQRFGNRIFEFRQFRKMVHPRRLKKVNRYFQRYGSRIVFAGRFMAGVRATVFLSAGILRMRFKRFIFLDGIAALLSVPLLVWVAYHFGAEIERGVEFMRRTSLTLLVAVVVGFALISLILRRRRKAKG